MLFSLALEPLACKIRQGHATAALGFRQRPLAISLYADDMLLYVREPAVHLEPLLREYVCFERYSGLGINWSKSTVFPLTECTKVQELEYPLAWSSEPVRYLGVWCTGTLKQYFV